MIIMRWVLEGCIVKVEGNTTSVSCPLALFNISSGAHRDTGIVRLLIANFHT